MTTRFFAVGFVNGALTQSQATLHVELLNAWPLSSYGTDWVCSPAPFTEGGQVTDTAQITLANGPESNPDGGACREPTAEQVIFDKVSTGPGIEAAIAMVAVAGGAEPTAAAAAAEAAAAAGNIPVTPVLFLSLWTELSASQSTPIPGAKNEIRFRLCSAVSLVPGDLVTFHGLRGFSTPNAPDIACINSTVWM